jgi:hypothetical protein
LESIGIKDLMRLESSRAVVLVRSSENDDVVTLHVLVLIELRKYLGNVAYVIA